MKCAYCGNEAKGTKEHIISSGILDLFPECFKTIDSERNRVYENDPMVKDVCADCNNNRISYIDSYAKEFVQKYFLKEYKKDDILEIEYSYTLLQKMCLKYAFNDMRSRKKDISFFDSKIINYLLNETEDMPLRNVTLIAGLAVNVSPMPDFVFGNMKIRWMQNPVFLSNSMIQYYDYNTGRIKLRDPVEKEEFPDLAFSFLFRFNSIQIIMLCWNESISEETLQRNNVVLDCQYPYTRLNASGKSKLSRCTDESNYHIEGIIDVIWGQNLMDEVSFARGTFSDGYQEYLKQVNNKWKEQEKELADEHPRK